MIPLAKSKLTRPLSATSTTAENAADSAKLAAALFSCISNEGLRDKFRLDLDCHLSHGIEFLQALEEHVYPATAMALMDCLNTLMTCSTPL